MAKESQIAVLMERFARVLQNDAHRDGLKPTQWDVLRYLARANRFSRSPGAVTAYLGMTKGTVSQTLRALENKGFVRKTSHSADRRAVHLELTPLGRKMLDQDPLLGMEKTINKLGRRDMSALAGLLEGTLVSMLQDRGGRPFGACKTCRHFRKNVDAGEPHFCNLLQEPLSKTESKQICLEQEAA